MCYVVTHDRRAKEDPNDVEAQKAVEEMIRMDRVHENMLNAMEHHPEAFGQVRTDWRLCDVFCAMQLYRMWKFNSFYPKESSLLAAFEKNISCLCSHRTPLSNVFCRASPGAQGRPIAFAQKIRLCSSHSKVLSSVCAHSERDFSFCSATLLGAHALHQLRGEQGAGQGVCGLGRADDHHEPQLCREVRHQRPHRP